MKRLTSPALSFSPANPQIPSAAEEAMLQSEVQALSSELREVREARHVLRAVREEAAQAIQAVRWVSALRP